MKRSIVQLVTLVIYNTLSAHAQCNSSVIGYALVGHVYKNLSAPDPLQCYKTCKKEEPKCRSFNFHADRNICELNNHSSETRPADIHTSEVAVYFHSCYRDRLGSKSSLAASSCAAILSYEDSIGDGRYWVQTNETGGKSAKIFCNMTNGGDTSASFDLIFPTARNVSNYVIVDGFPNELNALTVSLWIKSTEKILVPISYAVGRQMNAILLYLDETGLFRFLVAENQIEVVTGTLDDDDWHHVCVTWENQAGHVRMFIDGKLKISAVDIAVNSTVAEGGKFVLGQDQDSLGGGFDVTQSFAGEMSHFYLWDTALSPDTIAGMARVCKEFPYPGHVIGWTVFGGNLHGEVTRRNLSRCHFNPSL